MLVSDGKQIRALVFWTAVGTSFGLVGLSSPSPSAQEEKASGATHSSKLMPDGKRWITQNLDINISPSYCYEDSESNCRRYGRLYTWEVAPRACQALGAGWRLPTDGEWRELAKRYGGVSAESDDRGKSAYAALLATGKSGFDAVLGGGRAEDGQFARLDAHGFYWTSSDNPAGAWYYNFAKGGQALHRQAEGEKPRAFSVRCISD